MAEELVLNTERLKDFGQRMQSLFAIHEQDRRAAEERWLKNLRQFRGIYDPEILTLIGRDQSKAYPKLTRWKVIGTVARLMQMLFPQTEKNYGVKASPIPNLTTGQVQQVLDELVAAKGGDPLKVILTDDEIEKGILAFAQSRAKKMETKLDDDLQEMEFITLARKVVFSAVLYNVGVLKGPFHKTVKRRTWQRDEYTGKYTAVERDAYKPLFEFLPVWGWYPDMTATALDKQDGEFERHVMTRTQIEDLAKREDFLGDVIHDWLREHKTGNFRARWWETEMQGEPKSDKTNAQNKEGRKYEAVSYAGAISGHDLRAAGVQISDEKLGGSFQASVWLLDNVVIKARLAPFGDEVRQHHVFVFEDDDLSLLGNGQPDTLRDSQLSICELTRAALDNSSVIGPNVEVNTDLLASGTDLSIRKHKVWPREGEGAAAGIPAVRNIAIDSHLVEIGGMIDRFMDFADKESGLPPPSLGDVSGGGSEALRTQQNASMFLGAAALPIRDTVRNYDTFTISVVTSLVKWNMKYDPDPSRDGDFDIIARGSTSLIAKEVLAQSLDLFRSTLSPDELPHVKTRALLIQRAKARDIPTDEILEDEERAEEIIRRNAEAQARTAQVQEELVAAQVRDTLAAALKKVAEAQGEEASVSIDTFTAIMEALQNGNDEAGEARSGAGGSRPAA